MSWTDPPPGGDTAVEEPPEAQDQDQDLFADPAAPDEPEPPAAPAPDAEALVAAERTRLQAEFDQRMQERDRRVNRLLQDMRSQGLDWAPDGALVRRDGQPQAPAAPPAAQTPAAPEEPEPDAYLDPDGWKAWTRKQAVREAHAAIMPELQGLREQIQQVAGAVGTVALQPAQQAARTFLAGVGHEQLFDTPEFQREFAAALNSVEDVRQRMSPEMIEMATMVSLGRAHRQIAAAGGPLPAAPAPPPNPARTGLAQASGSQSRSGGAAPPSAAATPDERAQLAILRSAGVHFDSIEHYRAFGGPDPQAGERYEREQQRRQRQQPAGRR